MVRRGGNFELDVRMPVVAYDLLGWPEADRGRAAGFVEQSLAMTTVLVPESVMRSPLLSRRKLFRSGAGRAKID